VEAASAALVQRRKLVAATARVATRSTGRAVPIEAERGYVFDLRDGTVTRFAWFNDPQEAIEAVQETK
jgi:hypothetical protein